MKVSIIATHSFPIPYENLHTGDIVILQLANAISDMGHEVSLVAPEGSKPSDKIKLLPMQASYGKYPPSSQECEAKAFVDHKDALLESDIVHDFSTSKIISEGLFHAGYRKLISTIMGGPWTYAHGIHNVVGWSKSHADRIVRGAMDYEGTPTPDLAGHTGKPVKAAHVVNGGVETTFYTPTYDKKDFFLWMNRWHEVKGYKQAIELARKTGINLVLAGEHPDNEMFEYQRNCALEAVDLSKDLPNVRIEWLPPDPNHHIAKRELYRQAKALLYTVQFCEPFGLSQAEALACGTPVIGTNYGSVSEVIENGFTGYVCNNNVNEFELAIDLVNTIDPKICREQAVKRFDIKVMAQNYLNEYNEIIKGNSWL